MGGCIAGGRNYFHINANGDRGTVRFRPTIPTPTSKRTACWKFFIRRSSWRTTTTSRLTTITCGRARCWKNPDVLTQMVNETGAKSTDLQSPEAVESLCNKCRKYADVWKPAADTLGQKKKTTIDAIKYDERLRLACDAVFRFWLTGGAAIETC